MMASRHESMFSYKITRAYPFKWFTPVVLVGFLVATVLFSFLNLASNGYNLIVVSSFDPNTTVSEGIWFKHMKWPSYLTSKAKPSCQPANIQVNTLFFTNQTALTYTLMDVWRVSAEGNRTVLPSLTYYNNVIENCAVGSIEVDLEALDRTANQLAYGEYGAVIRAYISCTIESADGQTHFNLTTTYDYVTKAASLSGLYHFLASNFLDRDKEKRSSLYWGESLMSMYWAYTTKLMQNIRQNATANDEAGIRKGTISFTPNNGSTSDITSPDYFKVDYRFVIDVGLGSFGILWPGLYNWTTSVAYLDSIHAKPNIWIQADSLAKSAYSTILTDLGQTSYQPNILTNGDTLQYFTSNFSVAMQNYANAQPGPVTQDFKTLKATTGPLGATPSVISTNYICQIPKLKSAGNIFVSVLVADLVFLQALWKIFTLITDWLLFRKHPDRNQCQGCANHTSESRAESLPENGTMDYEHIELSTLDGPKRRSSYHSRQTSSQQLLLT